MLPYVALPSAPDGIERALWTLVGARSILRPDDGEGLLDVTEDIPDLETLVAHFGVPPRCWVDACYALSHSIAREFPHLGATVVEGSWTGEVAEGTHFRWLVDAGMGERGIAHWWLILPDGSVLDATRWVFEGREPYVYHGASDHDRVGR